MSEVKWIKLKVDMFNDEKIRLIESMPDGDTLLVIWFKLLSQAGRTNARGYIFLNENVPYTTEMLSTLFNRPITTVRLALQTFKQFEMIDIDEQEFISINNWDKHQNIDGMEKLKLTNAERQKRYRERKKQQALGIEAPKEDNENEQNSNVTRNVTDNVTSHESNAPDIDKEKDKNICSKSDDFESNFNLFWDLYANKKGRAKCLTKMKKILKKTDIEEILQGVRNYNSELQITGRYKKDPLTFLNGEHWKDEYQTAAKVNIGTHKKQNEEENFLERLERMKREAAAHGE